MTVKQIVEERLRKDGFDGLCGGRACDGCGCILDDLFPCGQDFSECVPGHAKWGTFDGEQTWRIFAPPPVQSDIPCECGSGYNPECQAHYPPPVQSDQSDDAPQPCENCNGRGVISFNPNLNPNEFPGVELRGCTRCNGTGESPDEDRREKSESRAGIPPFQLRGPTNH